MASSEVRESRDLGTDLQPASASNEICRSASASNEICRSASASNEIYEPDRGKRKQEAEEESGTLSPDEMIEDDSEVSDDDESDVSDDESDVSDDSDAYDYSYFKKYMPMDKKLMKTIEKYKEVLFNSRGFDADEGLTNEIPDTYLYGMQHPVDVKGGRHKDIVQACAKEAIRLFNEKQGAKLQLKEVKKANIYPLRLVEYFITLEAEDKSSPDSHCLTCLTLVSFDGSGEDGLGCIPRAFWPSADPFGIHVPLRPGSWIIH